MNVPTLIVITCAAQLLLSQGVVINQQGTAQLSNDAAYNRLVGSGNLSFVQEEVIYSPVQTIPCDIDCAAQLADGVQNSSPTVPSPMPSFVSPGGGGVSCADTAPQNAEFGCNEYAELKLCSSIPQENCQISCSRCPVTAVTDCDDVAPAGVRDCSDVIGLGICDADSIKGTYCRASCGDCIISTPNPTPTQSPNVSPTPPPPATSLDGCDEASKKGCDVDGLLAFKSSVSRGEDILSDWVGDDPCVWKYIICGRVDAQNKRVTVIDMDFFETSNQYKITATLVPDFSKLRYLEMININTQNVTGFLHKEYSVLAKLTDFRIYRTHDITGTLPPDYSTLTGLQDFSVSFNQLTGAVPAEYSAWKKLYRLGINNNEFTSTIPSQFSVFTNIIQFAVNGNRITGQLAPEFSEWKDCRRLYTFENRITGTLPPEYSVMSDMNDLIVRENKMSGVLPVQYSEWQDCENFLAWENFFSGTLPKQYSTLQMLETFSVGDNRLTGSLPVEYSTWVRAVQVEMSDNKLTGDIPSEWSTFSKFAEIRI